MVAVALLGGHTHETINGIKVHVWKRGETYIARGRLQGMNSDALSLMWRKFHVRFLARLIQRYR